jgi:hypothetical protein
MELEEDNFDYDWINNYEEEEEKYKIFYPEEIKYLNVICLYVNKENILEKIAEKEVRLTTSNKIIKEELIKIISENNKLDKVRYKLISILIYNFNLENNDLKYFLKNNEDYNLLTNLKNIEDYDLDSSISYFHDINTVYILFNKEENKKNVPHTRKEKYTLIKGKTRRNKH